MVSPQKSRLKGRVVISKSPSTRYGRRAVRSCFQSYLYAGFFLAIYLASALLLLNEVEAAGNDTNVWLLIGGGLLTCITGGALGLYIPRLLGHRPYFRSKIARFKKTNH